MARVSLILIRVYQFTLSPVLGLLGGGCKYTPTCSHYGYEAIHK
ncbi:MAG: membrane protein insertion efficiency factor YidD, partial [Candidatus Dormibacteraeota bacterium]|nr:membrane protein insertion efficiency factor YidD [Candidatus Dormibacteraeota bacterium]